MSKKTTTILTTTQALSNGVDKILEAVTAPGKSPSKSTLLNILAAEIAGPKHNWGYLTGAKGMVTGQGAVLPPAPSQAEADPKKPAMSIASSAETIPDWMTCRMEALADGTIAVYQKERMLDGRRPREHRIVLLAEDVVYLWDTLTDDPEKRAGTSAFHIEPHDKDSYRLYRQVPFVQQVVMSEIRRTDLLRILQIQCKTALNGMDGVRASMKDAYEFLAESDSAPVEVIETYDLTAEEIDFATGLAAHRAWTEANAALKYEFDNMSGRQILDWIVDLRWSLLLETLEKTARLKS